MENEDSGQAAEMLATRRSRRSTAGNRMATVMAEVALDDTLAELDDDIDFDNAVDEQDVFESDFESTDEEMEKQVEEAGEAEVAQEERRVKKAARSRLEKVTAAAHAKHKSTFNTDIQLSNPTSHPKLRPKANRVKLGSIVDAATGQAVEPISTRGGKSKTRTSKRKHTVLNTSATVTRLKESEQKKATQPKKAKAEKRIFTQGELIAMALDTEEGNIREHRDYLKNEAEKRKRARVVRAAVEGPKVRWISKLEEVKIVVQPDPPVDPLPVVQPLASIPTAYRSVYGPPGTLFTPTTYTYTSGARVKTNATASSSTATPQGHLTTTFSQYAPYQHSAFPVWPPPAVQQQSYYPPPTSTTVASSTFIVSTAPGQQTISSPASTVSQFFASTAPSTSLLSQPQAQNLSTVAAEPEYTMQTVTKDYVVHELDQQKGTPKPTWTETMEAMFGDHVKWDEVKVYTGKNRPLARPRQTCPITGRQARYLDPRTGVPYADSYAFSILSKLLQHEYSWNPSLGSYIDYGGSSAAVDESSSRNAAVDEVGARMDTD